MFPGPPEEELRQGDSAESGVGAADPDQAIHEGEAEEVSTVALCRGLPLLQTGRLLFQENGQQSER